MSAKSTESRVSGSGVTANLEWAFHSKGGKKSQEMFNIHLLVRQRMKSDTLHLTSAVTCSVSALMQACLCTCSKTKYQLCDTQIKQLNDC